MLCVLLSICGCSSTDTEVAKDTNYETTTKVEEDRILFETKPKQEDKTEEALVDGKSLGDMRVHFIDVGQADSTFIEFQNGQTMLIDAGESGGDVVSYIRSLKYDKIDYVIATHPHDDHIGGMSYVLNQFKIGRMYMPNKEHTTKTFENMLNAIESNNVDLYTAKAGKNVLKDEYTTVDIIAPVKDSYSNLNNYSVVVKITYGKSSFLFTGDAEAEVEQSIIKSGVDADVLKVGHHGSETSSCQSFIKAVSPKVAVISCGKENQYGHPDYATLVTLKEAGAEIFRTDEVGTVIVTADSNGKIKINKNASEVKENAPPTVVVQEKQEDYNYTTGSNETIVYRTRTGKKYHTYGCSYLKSIIETTVSEARQMGLEPCSRCDPPQ